MFSEIKIISIICIIKKNYFKSKVSFVLFFNIFIKCIYVLIVIIKFIYFWYDVRNEWI